MTLYSLDTIYQEALELSIDPDTGEIKDESLLSLLEEIGEEKEKKLVYLGLLIKNLTADEDAIDKEIKSLQARKKACGNKVDSLKRYVLQHLDGKIVDPRVELSTRKSESVVVTCEPDKLDAIFQRVKFEADKTAIKEYLKAGKDVQGAHLSHNLSLVVK